MARSADRPNSGSRADFGLTRRSLVAAGAVLATVGSTTAASAFASPLRPSPGFGNKPHNGGGSHDLNCFLSGTRLLTPTGEVPIEALAIGDLVVTNSGEERPIRWIGRRTLRKDADGWPEGVLPVRIAKGALAAECPHRDLYVSRAHYLYLNGVLVAAVDLINGTTLAAVAPESDVIDYIHVELDRHDVLVAEGAPCDSLLPVPGIRELFDNYEEYVGLYGMAVGSDPVPCAPVAGFNGGRSQFKSRMRSALAPIVDLRRPLDVVRDDLETRALLARAA